ncbi:hypothetical protein [Streptomyces sp. NPDC048481]|uniref:hypothetical protein n=1 Tax=Streptomyces sp. NPDC048481 TaxID=3365557 RepID=UPI0037149D96
MTAVTAVLWIDGLWKRHRTGRPPDGQTEAGRIAAERIAGRRGLRAGRSPVWQTSRRATVVPALSLSSSASSAHVRARRPRAAAPAPTGAVW